MSLSKELRGLLDRRLVQYIALAAMLILVAKEAVDQKFCVRDPDIWWHVKTGDWIVEHAAVPHNGLFSWTAAGRPWVACAAATPTKRLAVDTLSLIHI